MLAPPTSPARHIAQANGAAAARGFLGLISEQSIYNLMTREIELEVLPAAIEYGGGVSPWSRLHGGVLGGVLRKEREGRRRQAGRAREAVERNRPQIEAYEVFCEELGREPATVALGWLLHQRGVTAPIVGPRTLGQLDDALPALELRLDQDALGTAGCHLPRLQVGARALRLVNPCRQRR